MIKRAIDFCVAASTLVAFSPLMAAIAVAVKVDSRGPVLFVHERVGRGKRRFGVAKFRTMVTDAERSGPAITAARDPRITRVGAVLRKTKLDELPQLWNVLRGDMSLVGPRPEVPRYVETYPARYDRLFDVRPGLTDLSSLVFRHEEELLALARDREKAYREVILPIKLELALRGVVESSVRADLRVIAQTVRAVANTDSYGSDVLEEARRRIALLNGDV